MPDDKYPQESLTNEEAQFRHSDCEYIHVWNIVDADGDRRAAIFVWRKEDETDETGPDAVYWLAASRQHS